MPTLSFLPSSPTRCCSLPRPGKTRRDEILPSLRDAQPPDSQSRRARPRSSTGQPRVRVCARLTSSLFCFVGLHPPRRTVADRRAATRVLRSAPGYPRLRPTAPCRRTRHPANANHRKPAPRSIRIAADRTRRPSPHLCSPRIRNSTSTSAFSIRAKLPSPWPAKFPSRDSRPPRPPRASPLNTATEISSSTLRSPSSSRNTPPKP